MLIVIGWVIIRGSAKNNKDYSESTDNDSIEPRLPNDFEAKLDQISKKLGIPREWIARTIQLESRGNPKAKNKSSSAYGLLQWTTARLKDIGVTLADLKNMDAIEQLDVVFKTYYPYRNKVNSIYDAYLVVFYPAALGKPDTYQIGGSAEYQGNKSLDTRYGNNDGKLTVADVKKWVDKG